MTRRTLCALVLMFCARRGGGSVSPDASPTPPAAWRRAAFAANVESVISVAWAGASSRLVVQTLEPHKAYLEGETVVVEADGRVLRRWSAHDYGLPAASPDGHFMAFNVRDQPDIAVVDVDSGAVSRHLAGCGATKRLTWSPDGRRLVALRLQGSGASSPGTACLWKVFDGAPDPERIVEVRANVTAEAAFSSDGRSLYAFTAPFFGDPLVLRLDLTDPRSGFVPLQLVRAEGSRMPMWAYASDGSGGVVTDGHVLHWLDAASGGLRVLRTVGVEDHPSAQVENFGLGFGVTSVAVSGDGRSVAFRVGDWNGPGRLHVLDVATGRVLTSYADEASDWRARVDAPVLSPGGSRLLAPDERRVWWETHVPVAARAREGPSSAPHVGTDASAW